MLNALVSFKPAYKNILTDKVNTILALIPILIGALLYYFVGKNLFVSTLESGQKYIEKYLSEGTAGQIVYYVIAAILSVMLYFLISWTFVLVISLIASPFNDLLSTRIERKLLGKELPDFKEALSSMGGKIFQTLFNEVKKLSLIILLSIFSVVLSYIPFLIPISVIIGIMLLAIEFVDYSWSRNNLSLKNCVDDLKSNFINYAIGGGFFMLLVSIPLVNLIVPSYATSFFTTLWIKNNESRS